MTRDPARSATRDTIRTGLIVACVAALYIFEGTTSWGFFSGSWNSALGIVNFALVGAIMALGVNLQWGFAGLFNIGIMGFVALGGVAAVLVSVPAVIVEIDGAGGETLSAMRAGGWRILGGLVLGAATVLAIIAMRARMAPGSLRTVATLTLLVAGFYLFRFVFDGGVTAVEALDPARFGNLGGLNLPVILAWPVGGLLAAGAAWIIGKTALGLRSDYLAIATLGIAEIILAVIKNEDWLVRGVKNVTEIPGAAPSPIQLRDDPEYIARAAEFGIDPVTAATIGNKIAYSVLFSIVLIVLLVLAQLALKSPWGRMMRAIRDNEVAAEAMGKDVKARHLQIFILGSAICGIAGAMMTTLDGQLTPTSYQPLRFTFLIWVMVIIGGSGNNFGAVVGGFFVWWLWIKVPDVGTWLMDMITLLTTDGSWLEAQLYESVAHMRFFVMGLALLLVLRFSPRGLIPER